jgi:hypothetical protein
VRYHATRASLRRFSCRGRLPSPVPRRGRYAVCPRRHDREGRSGEGTERSRCPATMPDSSSVLSGRVTEVFFFPVSKSMACSAFLLGSETYATCPRTNRAGRACCQSSRRLHRDPPRTSPQQLRRLSLAPHPLTVRGKAGGTQEHPHLRGADPHVAVKYGGCSGASPPARSRHLAGPAASDQQLAHALDRVSQMEAPADHGPGPGRDPALVLPTVRRQPPWPAPPPGRRTAHRSASAARPGRRPAAPANQARRHCCTDRTLTRSSWAIVSFVAARP